MNTQERINKLTERNEQLIVILTDTASLMSSTTGKTNADTLAAEGRYYADVKKSRLIKERINQLKTEEREQGGVMDSRKLISQTAWAAEEYLTTGLNNSDALMNDLKLLATWVTGVKLGKPGTFAAAIINQAIKEYGPECDNLAEDVIDDLSTHTLESLKHWADYTFDHAERLLLDLILWDARARAKD